MERLLRLVCDRAVSGGRIAVTLADGKSFEAGAGEGKPRVAIRFADKGAERALLAYPDLTFGELYADGRLVLDEGDLAELMALIVRRNPAGRGLLGSRAVRHAQLLAARMLGRNDVGKSRANVAHHYDLDEHFYRLFLDADRNYSCAYFEHSGQDLDAAQVAKKRHVAAKLLVEPGQSVLDIGSGWGGLALYLANAARAGSVLGVTLSREQIAVARARAEEQGLAHRVRFDLIDYREVRGRFDRIVSVGMFEHVGAPHYRAFFEAAGRLLADDGVMLLHTIGWQGEPSPVNPWIARYIFPGGHIPTLDEMAPAIRRAGLEIADVEVLRLHYADTLAAWRARFNARREEAVRLTDERFCRMWDFYLASSEAGFRYDRMCVFQLQLARHHEAVPRTRDYIAAREAALRAREEAVPAG